MYDKKMKDTVSECEYAIFLSYYLCLSLLSMQEGLWARG